MTRFAILAVPLLVVAIPATAGPALDAEAFEAQTRGRTVYFYSDGQAYGVEHYLGNRQVAWSFANEPCVEGYWYPAGDMICFVYEGVAEPHCWGYFAEGGGLRALFDNQPGEMELTEGAAFGTSHSCTGPEVGV